MNENFPVVRQNKRLCKQWLYITGWCDEAIFIHPTRYTVQQSQVYIQELARAPPPFRYPLLERGSVSHIRALGSKNRCYSSVSVYLFTVPYTNKNQRQRQTVLILSFPHIWMYTNYVELYAEIWVGILLDLDQGLNMI